MCACNTNGYMPLPGQTSNVEVQAGLVNCNAARVHDAMNAAACPLALTYMLFRNADRQDWQPTGVAVQCSSVPAATAGLERQCKVTNGVLLCTMALACALIQRGLSTNSPRNVTEWFGTDSQVSGH